MKKVGKIVGKVNPYLRPHEWETINFLLDQGFELETILESRIKGEHTPDIKMNNLFWEVKSPRSDSSSIMKNTLRDAQRQADNIIISLKRTARPDEKCLREIEDWFKDHKKIKRIWVVTKRNKLIKIKSCEK